MAGWMKTPLGTEVDLRPGHIVLNETQLPLQKGHSSPLSPLFVPCLLWPQSPISATAELLLLLVMHVCLDRMSFYYNNRLNILPFNSFILRYRDGAGNTIEENSSVFSLIQIC